MATSSESFSSQAWAWKDLYIAALMEADTARMSARITDAERVIVERARHLSNCSKDNIQEEEAMDDALYALRALKTCLQLRDTLEEAA